ncbi:MULTISPECIES: hypothetical protein [Pseudomonadota]|jgi:hypothetical protein|nr:MULTISPECIES: hypothetical protein [Pseudomonadota]MDH6264546.1 serine phosphatase RsbU (regulator of sigma subunit) [Bradyrhizobium sp. BR13661]PZR38687.1 MAG: hypothetical protein DI523_37900 [Paraburkholderia fungorum]
MAKGTGKSGIELAQENVDGLIEYLEGRRGQPLPRYGVELNRSAIAKACGFDRKVFQTNPRCARILDEADAADRKVNLTRLEQAEAVREQKGKVDADRAELEAQNLRLMAENASLRRETERWRRMNALMTETGKLP